MAHSPPMTRKRKRATLVSYQIGTSGKAAPQFNLRAAFFAVKIQNGGREHGEGNTFQPAADSLLVTGCLGLRADAVGEAGAGGDHLGQVLQHHAGHLRPGGGHQHHRGGDGGRHRPDRPDGVPESAGGG